MILAATISILFSGSLLALLGLHDPKRVRNSATRDRELALAAPIRRTFGWLALSPAIVLAAIGEWWALLIWFGAICALGWLTATVLASDTH